jgi:hypothetical protein
VKSAGIGVTLIQNWSIHNPCIHPSAALSARGIIGPYVYVDRRGNPVTVNTEPCYRKFLLHRFRIAMVLINDRCFSKMGQHVTPPTTHWVQFAKFVDKKWHPREMTLTGHLVAYSRGNAKHFLKHLSVGHYKFPLQVVAVLK